MKHPLERPKVSATQLHVTADDPFGRARAVVVLVEQDNVVLIAPAGQSAVLSVEQANRLHHVLGGAVGATRRHDMDA